MSAPQEYRQFDPKEQILLTAPFTATFINTVQAELTPFTHASELSRHEQRLNDQIDSKVGLQNWGETVVNPQVAVASYLQVWADGTSTLQQVTFTDQLLKIGFELGTVEKRDVLHNDILQTLQHMDVINASLLRSKEGKDRISGWAKGVMAAGALIHDLPYRGGQEISTAEVSSRIKREINSIASLDFLSGPESNTP